MNEKRDNDQKVKNCRHLIEAHSLQLSDICFKHAQIFHTQEKKT